MRNARSFLPSSLPPEERAPGSGARGRTRRTPEGAIGYLEFRDPDAPPTRPHRFPNRPPARSAAFAATFCSLRTSAFPAIFTETCEPFSAGRTEFRSTFASDEHPDFRRCPRRREETRILRVYDLISRNFMRKLRARRASLLVRMRQSSPR